MTEESQMAEQTPAQGQDVQQEHQKYIADLGSGIAATAAVN